GQDHAPHSSDGPAHRHHRAAGRGGAGRHGRAVRRWQGGGERVRRGGGGRSGRGSQTGPVLAGLPHRGDPPDLVSEPAHEKVLARVVREHAGRLAASLVSLLGDFAAAEDLVQDAVETALHRWPTEGIPERPDAWLFTVARRRGLDVLRRESNYRAKLALLLRPEPGPRDDRLRLVFTCCHPALSLEARIALTLRVVCEIGRAHV